MYNTIIGSFEVAEIFDDELPVTVKVTTDAPLETNRAARWLNGLLDSYDGVDEIANISVGIECIFIEMKPVIADQDEATVAVDKYLSKLDEAASCLTDDDLADFRYDTALRKAMATSSEVNWEGGLR